ncbi:MAG: phosphohydrolase [Myxococcota bacterium]
MDRLEQTTFTAMRDATRDDYQTIAQHSVGFFSDLPNRVLKHLEILAGDTGGYALDRLTHSLQTATRAQRDGRDDEYVVCAVLHDIGDSLACVNHAQLAATVLQPFVSAKNHWIVEHHGIFQGYYFFHHLGLDRNMRDQFREHPYWKDCAEFCEKYDQNSFDPDYETLPLEHFEPLVQKVFAAPRESMYMPEEAGAVGGSRSD